MIPAAELIALFNRMYTEHWAYKWGASQTGCVDCAGAFVWAYRQFGQSIYHGSNRIARVYVDELLPIAQARPGMAAFKIRKPGQQYYDLKAEYKPGGKYYNGDVLDFYHIGLVDDDSNYVLNSQSAKTGFVRSKIKDNWAYVARLKAVEYTEETTMTRQVTGGTLNMRCSPDKSAALVQRIPNGAIVTIDSYGEAWCRVEYKGKHGYVMTQFLTEPQNTPVEAPAAVDGQTAEQLIGTAMAALERLKQMITASAG